MPRYPLNALGAEELERLVQSLLKQIIGSGTITFGAGADGAREATFEGGAPYPSPDERWSGHWIFQVKYHDVERIGGEAARRRLLEDLRRELARVRELYGDHCDNYVLATNVPLSSQAHVGTHDRIAAVAAEHGGAIEHVHVWGYDELCRFVDADASVRAAFRQLLTTGDMIARMLSARNLLPLDETIQMYLHAELRNDRYAQLDQAGDVGSEAVPLERIFTDLDVLPRRGEAVYWSERGYFEDGVPRSAMELLLSRTKRVVLIGGPGQGKSTLGQFLAQVHRATLLRRLGDLHEAGIDLEPLVPRIPFRVVLREMAQWIARRAEEEGASVEQYVARGIAKAAGGATVTPTDVTEIVRSNPCLFVFDGLDEVVDVGQRRAVLQEVDAFLDRAEGVLRADLQIVGSSRPNSYANEFSPKRFIHLVLQPMDRTRVDRYVEKWLVTRNLDDARAARLLETFAESASDPQLQLLLTTPLQVSIVIYVILSGGRPSRQRESLFNDYVDVIYRRERAKHRRIIETEKDVLIGLHQYLAYLLHRRAADGSNVQSTLSEEEFETEVRRYLTHVNPYADDELLERELRTLVSEARYRLVLIVENSAQQFGFELRSLQEYFAASHLVETSKDTEERYRRLATIATSSHWRNTALFFAGRVGRAFRGEAPQLIEVSRAVDRSAPDTLIRRGAALARAMAVDRVFGSNAGLQRTAIEEGLTQLEGDPDVWRLSGAAAEFGQLTEADQSQHLLPALVAKLNALDLRRARLAATTLARECDFDARPLAEVLQRRSREGSLLDRAATIRTLLEIDTSPATVACARAFAVEADPETFAAAFCAVALTSGADALLGGLERSRHHWRELARSAFGNVDDLGAQGASDRSPPTADEQSQPLEGWEAVRFLARLDARLRPDVQFRESPPPEERELVAAEQTQLADPRLDAARQLLVAAARLQAWRPPGGSLSSVWDLAAATDAAFPSIMRDCQRMVASAEPTPASAMLAAARRRDEAGFQAAAEIVGRFHHGAHSRARFTAAHAAVAESVKTDADRAAYLFGIPGSVPDNRTEARFGVELATFGELLGTGPRSAEMDDDRVAAAFDLATAAIGSRWPGLTPVRLRLLLRARDYSAANVLHAAVERYLDRVAQRSPDERLAGSSTSVALALLLPAAPDDPRLLSWLSRVTAPPPLSPLIIGPASGRRLRRVLVALAAHVSDPGPVDPAVTRGAAAMIVWLTGRPMHRNTQLRTLESPPVGHIERFLENDDALVRRAGLRLLRTVDPDVGNQVLLAHLDALSGLEKLGPVDLRLPTPRAPDVRTEVIAGLSAALAGERVPARARFVMFEHLSRLAGAQETDIASCESDLRLPLAAS